MLRHNGNQKTGTCCDNEILCRDIDCEVLDEKCRNIILLYRDNYQANSSRVLSQQSKLCRDIKSCRGKNICRDRK